MVVFGGEGQGTSFDDGARYCLAEDTWAMLPEKGRAVLAHGPRDGLDGQGGDCLGRVRRGVGQDTNHNDGARYNPSTDTWKPVTPPGTRPRRRFDFSAVWTGREMLVWGGYTDSHSRYQGGHADAQLNTGGRYDPASDTWKPITTKGAPFPTLLQHRGLDRQGDDCLGRRQHHQSPQRRRPLQPSEGFLEAHQHRRRAQPARSHVAVWTGKEMIVWGGSAREPSAASDYFENGARYDPETDTWKPMSTIGAPKGRVSVAAVWTGTEMVLWGGVNDAQAREAGNGNRFVGTGARYNPATDTWTEITVSGARRHPA